MAIRRKKTASKPAAPRKPPSPKKPAKKAAKKTAKQATSRLTPAKVSTPKKATPRQAAKKAAKKIAKKATPRQAPARKVAASRTKKAPARKSVVKKTPARKAAAKKTPARKAAAKKTPARKAPAKKATTAKPARKAARTPAARPAATKGRAGKAARPADLSWLDRFPALAALRQDAASGELGLTWLGEREANAGGREAAAHYADSWHLGTLWSDELWAACQEVVAGLLKVAEGPAFCRRQMMEERCSLYMHPDRPGELLLALSHKFPALLWVPFEATADGLRAALGAFWPEQRIPRLSLPRELRVFLGYMHSVYVPNPYSGEMEAAGHHELDRHWTSSPAMDPQCWGTAYRDDPWSEQRGIGGMAATLGIVAASRELRQQEDGAVSTFTQRTTFSRSQLGIETHRRGIYVGVLRYRPNPFPALVQRFNERCHTTFPTDLPIDLVASLHGFQFLTAEALSRALDEQTSDGARVAYLEALAAVRHPDLAFTEELRRWAAHPSLELRAAVVNSALQYNWMFLLEDMAAQDQPEDLGEFLRQTLVDGVAPPQYNDMGEPDWTDESDESDESDDESDEEAGE